MACAEPPPGAQTPHGRDADRGGAPRADVPPADPGPARAGGALRDPSPGPRGRGALSAGRRGGALLRRLPGRAGHRPARCSGRTAPRPPPGRGVQRGDHHALRPQGPGHGPDARRRRGAGRRSRGPPAAGGDRRRAERAPDARLHPPAGGADHQPLRGRRPGRLAARPGHLADQRVPHPQRAPLRLPGRRPGRGRPGHPRSLPARDRGHPGPDLPGHEGPQGAEQHRGRRMSGLQRRHRDRGGA